MRRVAIARCKRANARPNLGTALGLLELVPGFLLRHAQLPAVVPELKRHVGGGDEQQARGESREANAGEPSRARDGSVERQRPSSRKSPPKRHSNTPATAATTANFASAFRSSTSPFRLTMRPKPAIGIQAAEVRRQRVTAERPAAERQRAEHRGADRGARRSAAADGCRRTSPRAARRGSDVGVEQRFARHRRSRARRALRDLRRSSRCRRAARPPPAITTAVIASSRERGTSPRTRASSRRLALGCSVRSCCGVSFSAMVR